jgi:hypothetical protein
MKVLGSHFILSITQMEMPLQSGGLPSEFLGFTPKSCSHRPKCGRIRRKALQMRMKAEMWNRELGARS